MSDSIMRYYDIQLEGTRGSMEGEGGGGGRKVRKQSQDLCFICYSRDLYVLLHSLLLVSLLILLCTPPSVVCT